MMDKIFPKIHTEGYKFIVISVFVTLFFLFFSKLLGAIGILISIWMYYFFRDPERVSINDENYLVSPADGLITQVTEVDGPKELQLENKKFKRVSIFMNIFDCHVNRIPCSGKINDIFYNTKEFGKDIKSVSIEFCFQDANGTLTDNIVNKQMDSIFHHLAKCFKAKLRK